MIRVERGRPMTQAVFIETIATIRALAAVVSGDMSPDQRKAMRRELENLLRRFMPIESLERAVFGEDA